MHYRCRRRIRRQEKRRTSYIGGIEIDVFVTLDKGIEYQQNLGNRSIAVIVIQSRSSRLSDLQRHADACLRAMRDIEKGELVRV